MASFKALCLAGVASLAATATAHAADLPLPAPPPVYVPPPQPVVFGGNWYLRGDVGVGIADLRTQQSTVDTYVPDLRREQSSLDDSGIVDAGVGYRFNQFFRADVTGEYRTSAQYSAIESYNIGAFFPPKGARAYDSYSGSFRSAVGLVNGYVDVGTWYGITPFVGAGVGVADVSVRNITDISFGSGAIGGAGNGGGGFAADHSQIKFAFALMAGLDFAITRNLSLELGYRYLNMGNVSSGAINCAGANSCPNEVQHFKLASNDIRLGFRYSFADFAPIGPAPVLVSKY